MEDLFMISRKLAMILFLFIIVLSGCSSAPNTSNERDLSEFKPMPPPEDIKVIQLGNTDQ